MTVKVFKLISGEEVISEVSSTSDAGWFLEKPATIMLQQNSQGNVSVGIAPYMPYAENQKVYLHKIAVASDGTPDPNLKNEYNRIYGSGLITAPASALAGLKM